MEATNDVTSWIAGAKEHIDRLGIYEEEQENLNPLRSLTLKLPSSVHQDIVRLGQAVSMSKAGVAQDLLETAVAQAIRELGSAGYLDQADGDDGSDQEAKG